MENEQLKIFNDSEVFQKERPEGLTDKQHRELLQDLVDEAKPHLDLWVNRHPELDAEILLDLEEIDIIRTAYSCDVVLDTLKNTTLYNEYFVSYDESEDRDMAKDLLNFKKWVKTIAVRVTDLINQNVTEWKSAHK